MGCGYRRQDKTLTEHELQTFLDQDLDELASEYERIRARATEDPGTAGDEGEENWAKLIRSWLPSTMKVLTKGRILFPDRSASRQLDVLVLKPGYPDRLSDKKLYLSSGVAAAFECKTTLKGKHIQAAVDSASQIKKSIRPIHGSIESELVSPILFGLLAHSHVWESPDAVVVDRLDGMLELVLDKAASPRDLIDLVCVASLRTWSLGLSCEPPYHDPWYARRAGREFPNGAVQAGYFSVNLRQLETSGQPTPNPIAVLVAKLCSRLARLEPSIEPMAEYFKMAGIQGRASSAPVRHWSPDELLSKPALDSWRISIPKHKLAD